jgi:predicted amidohydrolase
MKVATSQYRARKLKSEKEFEEHVEWHVRRAAEQGAELLLLPEFFSVELLTLHQFDIKDMEDIGRIFEWFGKEYTDFIKQTCAGLAKQYQITLAAGTHFVYHPQEDCYYNTAFLFGPDGTLYEQNKIHPSYEMVYNKHLTTPGKKLDVFEINGVKYGIAICYDNSFPEVARILSRMGADIILAPTCCLDEWGQSRNILFAQARASENQVFVINSQLIGSIPFPTHIPYGFTFSGRSGIYAPIQPMLGTANAVVSQGEANVEAVIVGDIDLEYLKFIRENGHNRNRTDMRMDFYRQYAYQTN